MALICNVSLNTASMVTGQTPAPQATLTVYNPNASAVVVTGASVYVQTLTGQYVPSSSPPLVPIGAGQTTTVPAASSITFGPFSVVMPSGANTNPQQAVNQSGNLFPLNAQPAEPAPVRFLVGATVYGSDGSLNIAGQAGLLVSGTSQPAPGYQGGPLQFFAANNVALGFVSGVL